MERAELFPISKLGDGRLRGSDREGKTMGRGSKKKSLVNEGRIAAVADSML